MYIHLGGNCPCDDKQSQQGQEEEDVKGVRAKCNTEEEN